MPTGARGAARTIVFKLRSQVLAPGATLRLMKKHSFAPVTVRRLYPGPHRIALQVTTILLCEAEVQVGAAEG